MTEGAARLVDGVLPRVPVRQWVLSLPYRLRYLLAWDHGPARAVLGVAVRVLLDFQRQRACRAGIRAGRSGSVTVIAWTDGTRQLLFEPLTLLEKLAALIPRPWINLVVYHGVLAPHCG